MLNGTGYAGQADVSGLSLEDAELLADAHVALLQAQDEGVMVLGVAADGDGRVSEAHRVVAGLLAPAPTVVVELPAATFEIREAA